MATVSRQQAAGSPAPGSRTGLRKVSADESAHDEQSARARSTTGDLLNLVEQLSNFDRIGVTRLARHFGVWCVAAPILGVRQAQPAAVRVSARPWPD
jgi:hypothetical protein